jgi:TonB family protein
MPLTWGLFRPVILIPEDASRWSAGVRESVLRHESAHVRRLDLPRQFLEQIACALYWFHPLVWYAAVRADDARESACDDAVLSEGAVSADYASHLIEVARRVRPLGSIAATTFCNRLEGRIMSVLDSKRNRRALTRGAVLAAALAAGLLLTGISGMQLLAQDEEIDDETVYDVGDGVTAPKLMNRVEPEYSEEASKARYQGTVVLDVVIGEDGAPANVRLVRPLGMGLDEKAVEAVTQWRWEPALKDGEPVQATAQVEIHFRLDSGGQPQAEDDEEVYPIGNGVSAPKMIKEVAPEYSEEARAAGLEGTVVLSVVIDEEGVPQNVEVKKELGLGLDEKAIEAVQQWRFEPAMRDGKPVRVAAQVEVNFRNLD